MKTIWFFGCAVLLFSAGCGSNAEPAAPAAPLDPAASPGMPAAGEGTGAQLYSLHCARCHTSLGKVPSKGPDLAHTGADPKHTSAWLAEHIRQPRSHTPNSTMPPFEATLSADDITKIADYLAGLK